MRFDIFIQKLCQKNINQLLKESEIDYKDTISFSEPGEGCSSPIFFIILLAIYLVTINIFYFPEIYNKIILFFFIIPPVFMMFYKDKMKDKKVSIENRIKSLKLAQEHLNQIFKVLNSEEVFFLYLRDFKTGEKINRFPHYTGGAGSGVGNPINWNRTYGNERTTKILAYFSKFNFPIIMLNNTKERTYIKEKNTLVFYSPNNIWINCIEEFIIKANFILIDFNFKKLTRNIKIEIDSIIKNGKKNIIFIGSDDCLKIIEIKYPNLYSLVIYKIIHIKHISKEDWRGMGKKDTNLYDFNFDNLNNDLLSSLNSN